MAGQTRELLAARNWDELEPFFARLLEREVESVAALEALLRERSELDGAVLEAEARVFIEMTRRANDEEAQRAHARFGEAVMTPYRRASAALDEKITSSPWASSLDPNRFGVLLREALARVNTFSEKNLALIEQEEALERSWLEITGSAVVVVDGSAGSVAQADALLASLDRSARERAWKALASWRSSHAEELESTFDRLVDVRSAEARNAGFADYCDFSFEKRRRFDYSRDDCHRFHEAVAEVCVPRLRQLSSERAEQLGVDRLRPWDLRAPAAAAGSLRPFETAEELVRRSSAMFRRMDPTLNELFDRLSAQGGFDLEPRSGKAPGAYQVPLYHSGGSFIFMNATGTPRDLEVFVHEVGHAFHSLLCEDEDLQPYRDPGAEISEVASIGLELLTHPYLDEFYPEDLARRAKREHLERVLGLFATAAKMDAFQHGEYDARHRPSGSRGERWSLLSERFGPFVDGRASRRSCERSG